jgi:hypothetical protein
VTTDVRDQDVERILRDVLTAHGVHVSAVRADRTPDGWRVTVTDVGGRILSTEIATGSPAVSTYLTMAEAARYCGCKSVRAFYEFRKRPGITKLGDGTIPRLELDRLKKRHPRRHRMDPNSLENLRRGPLVEGRERGR